MPRWHRLEGTEREENEGIKREETEEIRMKTVAEDKIRLRKLTTQRR